MTSTPTQSPWLFDSGASHHTTSSLSDLQSYTDYGGPDEIRLGDGKSLKITHIGSTSLPTVHQNLSLTNVLCVPKLRKNLVSIAKLCKTNQVSVEYFSSYFLVKDLCTGMPLMRGENVHDVYCAPLLLPPQVNFASKASMSDWHHTLGHPSNKTLSILLKNKNIRTSSVSRLNCSSCSINKSHKLPFFENSLTSTKPLELIYTDV